MSERSLTLQDLERAIATLDPQLGDLLVRYLAQEDPEPGHGELELGIDEDDEDAEAVDVPPGAVTIDALGAAVSEHGLANKTPTEKKLARCDAFSAAEASPFAPPRLRLGDVLVALYERGDEPGRAALIHAFAHGRMQWGVWKAFKEIWKRAEQRHDAALFGVLAYRIDAMATTERREIGIGTLTYLRRRAWRHLRLLGAAVPEAYAVCCVEVLRHYPASYGPYSPSWVAAQIWGHANLLGARGSASFGPPTRGDAAGLGARAFPQAWKVSPAPLLRLLEAAPNELVCDFAIRSLRADHPLALRAVEPAWLARLGRRPVAAIHAFVVSLLRESPELHQSKLAALGLHDVVIGFLRSPSPDARAYALEYAAAHAPDLATAELVELVLEGAAEVARFAAPRLESKPPQELGLGVLLRLLGAAAAPWAAAKLGQGFSPRDIGAPEFVETVLRVQPFKALLELYNGKGVAIPAGHWTALLDDPRTGDDYKLRSIVQTALQELGKRPAREIGIPWVQHALEQRRFTDTVVRWLDAGMLSGAELDVDWLKGLVGKPRLRAIALRLLGDRRRVAPARVGLAWLLELARSSDPELSQFARRMLLESFQPEDFAEGDRASGVARLWELAAGKKSPEPVRVFAATYLTAHHPELGPRLAEAKALGIQPRLDHDAYARATVEPLLSDDRDDVRRLAVAVAGEELVRWGDRGLPYALASARHREPRALGAELLLGVLVEGDDTRRVPADWIDGARLFQLAESAHKAAREVALTVIRRLYDRVGGAERLAWLMESPERDVRLFAVRLFWERHRPKAWAADFAPRKAAGAAIGTERFEDLAALRRFARVVLFGLPPGRLGERDPIAAGAPAPERPLPASVAKRRLIEAIRDVALEDVELANAIAPVLREFTSSLSKFEWQASVQALVALRAHHRDAFVEPGAEAS